MKSCNNCHVIHADDYAGQCHECGAPMGSVAPNGNGEMTFRYASQVAAARRELDLERDLKRGNYSKLKYGDNLHDIAKQAVEYLEECAGRNDA